MKKLLLTAAAVSALSTSTAMATEGDFYGVLYGGVNKLNDVKVSNFKLGSDATGHIGLGVGYYINNTFRADLTLDHLFDPKFDKTAKDLEGDKRKEKVKGEVNALMINGYADLVEAGFVQVYAGAGIGVARIKGKFDITYSDPQFRENNDSAKAKQNNQFAYALHLGVTGEVSHGVHAFLGYSWKDYGKTAKFKDKEGNTDKGVRLRGHHGTVGVRVDF